MKITDRHRAELVRAARAAIRRFRSVRLAAQHLGMSRSSFHDLCRANRIDCTSKAGPRRGR